MALRSKDLRRDMSPAEFKETRYQGITFASFSGSNIVYNRGATTGEKRRQKTVLGKFSTVRKDDILTQDRMHPEAVFTVRKLSRWNG